MVKTAKVHGKGQKWLRTYDTMKERELRRGGDVVLEQDDTKELKVQERKRQ